MAASRTLLACCLLASVACAQQDAPRRPETPEVEPQVLDRARFEALRSQLQPDADAPWRSIAWRVDLLAAQREAAAADKPLFVWAMDGHPLGCT